MDDTAQHERRTGAPPELEAVIFDVDGTLADTERDGHRPAFNAAFAHHDLDIRWSPEEYGRLLAITGGRRRLAGYLRDNGYGVRSDALADSVHRTKTELFRARVVDNPIAARAGVLRLVRELTGTGIRIAVATTGRQVWAQPLVTQLLGEGTVEALITGDSVTALKPDPQAYHLALRALDISAAKALAVEDSAIGMHSALAAGVATVVVSNDYTAHQDFTGAAEVRQSFDGRHPLSAARCVALHQGWWQRLARRAHNP